MAKPILTAARLRELLHYDPETGLFVRKVARTGKGSAVGSTAGSLNSNGYVIIGIDGALFRAHRLAWLYMAGEWPEQHIDHIDGIRNNNRWANLRDVSRAMNAQNQHAPHSRNKSSGLAGVSWNHKCSNWKAYITVSGKRKHIGYFKDPALAHLAYLEEKRRLHPGCTI